MIQMRQLLLLIGVAAVILLLGAGLSNAQLPSLTLDWTAPGDDGNVGTCSVYSMRWSTIRPDTLASGTPTSAWWNAATIVPNMPTPLVAGTPQSVTVPGPFPPGTYYFVLTACDEVPNCSYSNVAIKTITLLDVIFPGRVKDLR